MVSQYTDKSGSRYIVKFLTFSLKKTLPLPLWKYHPQIRYANY